MKPNFICIDNDLINLDHVVGVSIKGEDEKRVIEITTIKFLYSYVFTDDLMQEILTVIKPVMVVSTAKKACLVEVDITDPAFWRREWDGERYTMIKAEDVGKKWFPNPNADFEGAKWISAAPLDHRNIPIPKTRYKRR